MANLNFSEKFLFGYIEGDNQNYKTHISNGYNTFFGNLKDFAPSDSSDSCDSSDSDSCSNLNSNFDFEKLSNSSCAGWYFDTCNQIKTQGKGILEIISKSKFINHSVLDLHLHQVVKKNKIM
mgnify:CR=1 FL=1